MHKISFLCFGVLILSLMNMCSQKEKNKPATEVKSQKNGYKILELDSIQGLYLIYAQRNDSIFKVSSPKKNSLSNCLQLVIGEVYDLRLHSLMGNRVQKQEVAYYKYDTTYVKLGDKGTVWDIYVSENLAGLCFKDDVYKE